MLPGAIFGAFLVTFPLHWILFFLFNGNETDIGSSKFFVQLFGNGISYEYIEYSLSPFIIAVTFVLVGSYIAPKHKLKTSVVFTILYFTTFISLLLFLPNEQVEFGIRGVGALMGSLLGLLIAWKKYRSTNVPQY